MALVTRFIPLLWEILIGNTARGCPTYAQMERGRFQGAREQILEEMRAITETILVDDLSAFSGAFFYYLEEIASLIGGVTLEELVERIFETDFSTEGLEESYLEAMDAFEEALPPRLESMEQFETALQEHIKQLSRQQLRGAVKELYAILIVKAL